MAAVWGCSYDYVDVLTTTDTGIHGIFGAIPFIRVLGSPFSGIGMTLQVGSVGTVTFYPPGGEGSGTGSTGTRVIFNQIVNVTVAPCSFTVHLAAGLFDDYNVGGLNNGLTLVKL